MDGCTEDSGPDVATDGSPKLTDADTETTGCAAEDEAAEGAAEDEATKIAGANAAVELDTTEAGGIEDTATGMVAEEEATASSWGSPIDIVGSPTLKESDSEAKDRVDDEVPVADDAGTETWVEAETGNTDAAPDDDGMEAGAKAAADDATEASAAETAIIV